MKLPMYNVSKWGSRYYFNKIVQQKVFAFLNKKETFTCTCMLNYINETDSVVISKTILNLWNL